jgi:hypothetical protein
MILDRGASREQFSHDYYYVSRLLLCLTITIMSHDYYYGSCQIHTAADPGAEDAS